MFAGLRLGIGDMDLDVETTAPVLTDGIPGVFEARQQRSIRIRDAYVQAGIDALNAMRLRELRVSDLARACACSVGSFYTRFQDKEAYFRALIAATIVDCDRQIDARVSEAALRALGPERALDEMVELMADIFSGRFRGVLRETLLRILEPDDPWAPMRGSARRIIANYHAALGDAFPAFSRDETRTRLSFCFQIVVGVLQNDLVNDYHVFSTRDRSVRAALKENLRSYMAPPLPVPPHMDDRDQDGEAEDDEGEVGQQRAQVFHRRLRT